MRRDDFAIHLPSCCDVMAVEADLNVIHPLGDLLGTTAAHAMIVADCDSLPSDLYLQLNSCRTYRISALS